MRYPDNYGIFIKDTSEFGDRSAVYIPLKNDNRVYGLISQLLHWIVAALIIMQFIWAWRILQLGLGRQRYDLVNEHKSIGLTILALVLLRLIWRYFNPPPPLPTTMPPWQRRLALVTHYVIYGLLLVIPPVGWAMSSAAGFVVSWFDVFDLPALVAQDDALKEALKTLHVTLALALGALVIGHAAVAVHHHFVRKDDILKRMLPLWRRP
ncbi:cytochrome b [Methylophaga sp. OBS4]|nr:cytochrome b [Methylophaga sp. OBS4]